MKEVAIIRVFDREYNTQDILTIWREPRWADGAQGAYVLTGYSPPRFILRKKERMDVERFVEGSGLYDILEVERYD